MLRACVRELDDHLFHELKVARVAQGAIARIKGVAQESLIEPGAIDRIAIQNTRSSGCIFFVKADRTQMPFKIEIIAIVEIVDGTSIITLAVISQCKCQMIHILEVRALLMNIVIHIRQKRPVARGQEV